MPDFTFSHRDEGFDNHIDSSIRGYNVLHDDIVNLSRYFVEDHTKVVDIGCSTGKTLAAMIEQNDEFAPKALYNGVEYASGFVDAMKEREERVEAVYPHASLNLHQGDIRDYDFENCSLVTSIFTLQFMPQRDRRNVVKRIHSGLNDGGAFIFAEKTVAQDARLQEMMTFTYYDYKRTNFEDSDILDKERTLRNMLKPMTWKEIQSLLACAGFGFDKIQPFWQNHMFVGAIALK